MGNGAAILLGMTMLGALGIVAYVLYQQNAGRARTPGAQIGGGIGQAITGILGAAGVQ